MYVLVKVKRSLAQQNAEALNVCRADFLLEPSVTHGTLQYKIKK